MPTPPPADDDCPECRDQKTQAEARAKASTQGSDGLRLGSCNEKYKEWADCIEREKGQAKACAAVLKEFRECHSANTIELLPRRP